MSIDDSIKDHGVLDLDLDITLSYKRICEYEADCDKEVAFRILECSTTE